MDVKFIAPNGKEYIPNKAQAAFHKAPELFVYGSGGLGSGKSVGGIISGIILSLAYPKNFGVVVREDIPSLKQSTMRAYLDWCPKAIIKDFNKQDRVLTLVNDSQIIFISSDNPEKVRSWEIGWFHLEEANKIPEEFFNEISRRLRCPHVPSRAYRGMLTSNPVSKQHWAYKLFTKGDPNYRFIQSSSYENEGNLPNGYIKMLESTMSPEVAERFIQGHNIFNPVGCAVYGADFVRRFHVGRFNYNPDRPVMRGWDFGFHRPACVWFQVDDDGRVYVLSELMGKDVSLGDFAKQVLSRSIMLFPEAQVWQDFCDPAGNQVSDKGDGETSVQILSHALGHSISHTRTKILEGVERIRSLMRSQSNGKFMFQVDESCETLVEGFIGGYHYDEKKPDVIVKDGHYDHLQDALRYGIIGTSGITQGDILDYYRQEYAPINSFTGY